MHTTQKRLAILIPSMSAGGAERSMIKLARGLVDRGYDVDMVLARAHGPNLADVPSSVRIVDLKASRMLTSLPGLVRYLSREKPDSMLCIMNYANIVALWARRLARVSTRMVVSERIVLSLGAQNASTRRGKLIARLATRFYPWADAIVAVSKGVADDLVVVTGLPRERVHVIYNPIVTPELKELARAELQHPWFEPGQPPVLLGVGRLKPQKDFPTLIRAFAAVRQKRPARLLIVGDGPERPALEALIADLGLESDVSLPGYATNPYPYMVRAAVFVLSSRFEGLPGVLIEALYCGVPLVSTDCPSGPREILAGGQFGQLVPIGDVTVMTEAIELALDGKGPRAPAESLRPFEQEAVVSQYLDVLLGSSGDSAADEVPT